MQYKCKQCQESKPSNQIKKDNENLYKILHEIRNVLPMSVLQYDDASKATSGAEYI